ncbi:MAG: 5'-methylthioadenosine/adenosylhomocysteine nucleosidase [Elusimicrobiota bacterium]|nr:5'-methylthioadenosine/adenosylhomocysteine nucleosidase [Elusimicrobiota bacterium]
MKKIGIIGAMEIELKMLKKELDGHEKISINGLDFFCGHIKDTEVVIVRCGIGKVNAALCAQTLILQFKVTHIINTGIAGAISSELRPLDIVLSTALAYHDVDLTKFGYPPCTLPNFPQQFAADEKLLCAAREVLERHSDLHFFCGLIASGDVFVATKECKQHIKKLLNPMCVEMEGAAIAHIAFLSRMPFIVIRAISDLADDFGLETYEFNENKAAQNSAKVVMGMLEKEL